MTHNRANKPIDLAVLEAYALTGADEAFGKAISAVCAELRGSRKVVEGARVMRSLYPHIWEEFSRNGLDSSLSEMDSFEVKNDRI